MTGRTVTIFGGSGYLGRHIVAAVRDAGWMPRIAVRRPDRVRDLIEGCERPAGEAVAADVRDEASVRAAIAGASAVVNTVGLYVEGADGRFDDIHVAGAGRVAELAGAARLIHISGIGVDTLSASPYVRARARGEEAVRLACPDAVILRPSALFGPGDALFTAYAKAVRSLPIVPLFGRGDAAIQPVYVGDVARAVAAALASDGAAGQIFELGGPDRFTYRDILELVMQHTGRRRLALPIPIAAWTALARVLSVLPNPPVTRDMVELVRRDNVASPGKPGLSDLGVMPTPAAEILPSYVSRSSR